MAITLNNLEDAFLFISSGFDQEKCVAIHKKTGNTFYQSDMSGIDELPKDVDNGEYVFMPYKNELGLGIDLGFDFFYSRSIIIAYSYGMDGFVLGPAGMLKGDSSINGLIC